MPERTVKAQFFTYAGGRVATRGQTVDFSEEDAARGDALGAFEESEAPVGGEGHPDALTGAFGGTEGNDPESGLPRTNDNANTHNDVAYPEGVSSTGGAGNAPAAAAAPTAESIDALSGDDLDNAVAEAGIDASTGGSLKDGGLTADEKRAALKAHHQV